MKYPVCVPRIPDSKITYNYSVFAMKLGCLHCFIPTSLPFAEMTHFTALAYSKFHEIGESQALQVHWATPIYTNGGPWRLEFGETFCLLGLLGLLRISVSYQTCALG